MLGRAARPGHPPYPQPQPTCLTAGPNSFHLPTSLTPGTKEGSPGARPCPPSRCGAPQPVQGRSGASSHHHMVPAQVPSGALRPARAPLTLREEPSWIEGRGKRQASPPPLFPGARAFLPLNPCPPDLLGQGGAGAACAPSEGGRLAWTLLPAGVPPPNFLQPGPDRDPVAAVAADVANARVAAARNHPDPASAPPSRWGRGLSGGGACGNLREGLEAAGCGSWSRA